MFDTSRSSSSSDTSRSFDTPIRVGRRVHLALSSHWTHPTCLCRRVDSTNLCLRAHLARVGCRARPTRLCRWASLVYPCRRARSITFHLDITNLINKNMILILKPHLLSSIFQNTRNIKTLFHNKNQLITNYYKIQYIIKNCLIINPISIIQLITRETLKLVK